MFHVEHILRLKRLFPAFEAVFEVNPAGGELFFSKSSQGFDIVRLRGIPGRRYRFPKSVDSPRLLSNP